MITTRGSIVIPAAPAEVYAFLVDQTLSGGLMHQSGAVTVDIKSTVVERVPHRRVVMVNEISPFGFAPTRRGRFGRAVTRVERTLEPHPDGTLVSVHTEVRIEPLVLRLYFAVVKRGQWQRATDEALVRMRRALDETGDA